jgi:hypothetical protein
MAVRQPVRRLVYPQHLVVRQLHILTHKMKTKKLNIKKLLDQANQGPSRWYLDNVVWNDRTSNPETLLGFLTRIDSLTTKEDQTPAEKAELKILNDLAQDLDEAECAELLSNDDEVVQQTFIENLARQSALEVLTNEKISIETMRVTCKLSPSDFIMTAKRTQDIINAIHELVIQGETLSNDVAGA